ncbi:MAG: hypothetical protein WBF93_17860 [Pirellulales bacterium]
MAKLHQLLDHILEDRKITDDEVQIIEEYIVEDGTLDIDDVRFLVQLLTGAEEVCPAFDDLFFPVLKGVILKDGRIDHGEQFYLLKMLYGDGEIRECELRFLSELSREAKEVPAEFQEMCRIAAEAHPTEWSVEGNAPRRSSLASGR